jgi:hypothetical protein
MKIVNLTLLALALLTATALRAEPSAAFAPPTPDPLAEALPVLESKYVDFKALNYKPGDHLGDLVGRSGGEISVGGPAAAATSVPVISDMLPNNVIYWRLASFTPAKDWSSLENQLVQQNATATGIILDLRSNSAPDDYAGAAHVLAIFEPRDLTLSKYGAADLASALKIPPLHLPMVLLINHDTTGSAEVLAACLKTDGALAIGRETQGRAAIFQEEKLPSGQVLRFAVDNIPQPNGTPFFGHPVVPDITLPVDDRDEKAALVLIKDNHISDVIQESAERHRLSEATLVQGQDPEWDDYLASLEQKPVLLSLPVIHDAVLVSALDSLKAIRLSERPFPSQATATASLPDSTSVQ